MKISRRNVLSLSLVVALASISACGLVDSRREWQGGPYALTWIDEPAKVTLVRDAAGGGQEERIAETVFAVGWDGRYLVAGVAKQHPRGNKAKTNYYVIDSSKDTANAKVERVVMGPFSKEVFEKKSAEMKLPAFTKVLASLE